MSNARAATGGGQNSNVAAMEGRPRHIDEEEIARMKSKMRDINQRVNSMHMTDRNQTLKLPSPFSGNGHLKQPFRAGGGTPARSPGANLKLDTTPEALHEQPDYVSSRPAGIQSAYPMPSNSMSPLTSPLSGSNSTYSSGPRTGGPTPAGGQAAEMQARILALQRSRSKRAAHPPSLNGPSSAIAATQYSSASASSPQLNTLPRRSSSASSNGGGNQLPLPPQAMSHSRSSVSTLDSMSGDEDDSSRSSSPSTSAAPNNFDSYTDMRPLPTPTDSNQSQTISPGSSTTTIKSASPLTPSLPKQSVPKQPLANNGFDPNTVISPTAASFAQSGGPVSLSRASSFRSRQRSSLSARRGMKLDPSALSASGTPASSVSSTPRGSVGSNGVEQGRPFLRNGGGGGVGGVGGVGGIGGGPRMPGIPKESGERGFFRDYKKYIDIETGSLNFAGKACVHAQGIEFSSGEKFNISIDKLEFISELGSGNYGTVQKVLHTPNGVFMAVKEIRLELDEASLRQIIMELDVLHRCEMSNIIAFYGAFFVEGSVYICMEYMDGGSVNKIYESGISEKYLKYIVRSVVAGLKQLKEQFNIIHRDVKPTNILCSTSGDVKLCDFGVSGNLVASIARTNIGCQAYMAPERIKVDRASMVNQNQPMTYTAESDIWSLGLSIIEMAKGSYPYPSDSFASIFSQLNAIVEEPSPALDPTKFSPEACDFVNQLLCKSPTQRPKYADIVKHPWLAEVDCTKEEMGAFVKERIAKQQQLQQQQQQQQVQQQQQQ